MLTSVVGDFLRLVRINTDNASRTYAMAQVALTKRYSGSALGAAWALVKPLIFVFAYWFAVNIGIRGGRSMGEIPYILWLIPGIMPWFYISDALTIGGSAVRSNSHFVTKMVYPVATLPVSEVLSLYMVHLMMMCVTVAIFVISGYGLSIYFIQLPYYLLCTAAFTVVVATLLSALTAVSQDVRQAVKSLMTLLFWMSPVLWSADKLSSPLKQIVLANPIAYLTGGYRNAFVYHRWFFQDWEYMLYFWGMLAILALLASYVFTKLEGEFADVL
ncbi:MAG: ABC transporter permease [Coriobacteriia bacterium]|nr:ABC transporter permease [Coriobacteriia bacterium]